MIVRVRRAPAGTDDDIESGLRFDAIGGGPEPSLDSIADDSATHCFAGDEAESGDAGIGWYYAQDQQLVSVDTTLAVRGGKVFAPA